MTKSAAHETTKKSRDRKGASKKAAADVTSKSSKAKKQADRVDQNLAKALAHPLRVHILAASHQRPVSPSEIARRFDEPVPNVSYHFKELVKFGALEFVGTETVRGAVKHLYVGTERAIFTEADWLKLPGGVKTGLAGATLQDYAEVTASAIDSGSFVDAEFVFTWDEANMDTEGVSAMLKVLKAANHRIKSVRDEAAGRLAASGEDSIRVVFKLGGFLAPSKELPENAEKA
jgi:predicted transcriptional regulator